MERLTESLNQLFRGADGLLKADAKRVLLDLRRQARIDAGLVVMNPNTRGSDHDLTMMVAGRREIYDRFSMLLGLDDYLFDTEDPPDDRPNTAES